MSIPSPLRTLLPLLVASALASSASAQRVHVGQLIGDMPPDVSNWPHPAAPDGNPYPRSTAPPPDLKYRILKEQLGKTLFWDEQVGINNTMACGTCHFPEDGGTDPRLGGFNPNGNQGSFGVVPQANVGGLEVDYGFTAPNSAQIDRLVTPLAAPTMIGAYVFERLFWDQRAGPDFQDENLVTIPNFADWAALEAQAVGPVINDIEMGHQNMLWSQGVIQKKLNNTNPLALVDPTTIPADILWLVQSGAHYAKLFDSIFGADPQFGGSQGVTRERFALALAHYMRTLIPDYAPIDRGTMTKPMVKGMILMQSSGCFNCHSISGNPQLTGPGGTLANAFDNPLSDGRQHDIGFGPRKTPTLRNVGLHKKFFSHGNGNGGLNTLDDVIDFYDHQIPGLDLVGTGPNGDLTAQEFLNVKAFLGTALTDPRVAAKTFPFDRPELASERLDFNPFETNEYGNATPGPSNTFPEIVAEAPPLVHHANIVNNIWFKVGVGTGIPGAVSVPMVSNTQGGGPVLWVGGFITFAPTEVANADGIATSHLAIPLVPASIGQSFFVQWFIDDNGTPAFSDAAEFKPFQF